MWQLTCFKDYLVTIIKALYKMLPSDFVFCQLVAWCGFYWCYWAVKGTNTNDYFIYFLQCTTPMFFSDSFFSFICCNLYDIVLMILKIFPLFLLKKQEWKSCIIWVVVVWNFDEGENQLKFQWTGLIFAQNTGHRPEVISPLFHRCTIFILKYIPKADRRVLTKRIE